MTERTVTIFVRDDGTVDLSRFADVEELSPVKKLIDELRKENGTRRRDNERQAETITSLEIQLEDLTAAQKAADEALKAEKKADKALAQERDQAVQERDELRSQLEQYSKFGTVESLAAEMDNARYGKERRVADRLTDAAEKANLNPRAVTSLRGLADWEIVEREVEQQDRFTGTKSYVTVPFVVERDAEGKETRAVPFRDKVLNDYAPLRAALTVDEPKSGTSAQPRISQPQFNPSAPVTNLVNSQAAFTARDPLMVDPVAMPAQNQVPVPGAFYNPENALGDALREQFGQ